LAWQETPIMKYEGKTMPFEQRQVNFNVFSQTFVPMRIRDEDAMKM